MINLRDVSYCRLGTRDLEGAIVFATEILGLEVAERYKDAVYFKSDARTHTLCYFEGDPADQAVAFEVAAAADLDQAGAELERAWATAFAAGRRRSASCARSAT